MNRKIAILRGINVSGNRKIIMSDLREMFSDLGFSDVLSYIQSGNIIFSSEDDNDLHTGKKIESEIQSRFGFSVPVIILDPEELGKAVEENPFYTSDVDTDRLHLTVLKTVPDNSVTETMEVRNFEPDKYLLSGRFVFIYCAGKYHETKLSNNYFEKLLKGEASTRNWRTVLKILAISKTGMQ